MFWQAEKGGVLGAGPTRKKGGVLGAGQGKKGAAAHTYTEHICQCPPPPRLCTT